MILSAGVQAELVDGPANIREQPNGKILFSIKDNVPVDYSFYQDDWYSITLTVSTQEARFSMGSGILKDTILYDLNGNEIGRALDNIPISKERITYNQESHTYKCILEGYTFKNNLKDNISTVSIAERINAPNKKCGVLIDIAKSCIQMNQQDNADKILAELLVTTDTIGTNPNYIGNSYDENDEKAYKLRDIALLYFQMGKMQKAIEILNNAVIEARNIKGACDQYLYRDKAWEDFAFDFIAFGEYELGIKTIRLTGGTFADRALSEVIDKYLANNDITTAKKTVDLIKNKNIKEQALVNISLKDVNLNNINTYIKLIKSLKEEPIKCAGLAQLAVKYFNLKGDGDKITSDLLNESFEIAKRIKNHYQRDGLLAEIAGRYAEVKQFEKAKALALKIEWSISKARGLMNIAIQYAGINHRGQAENLLDQAWNITGKSDEGLDQEEMFQAMITAYCECGLINKIVSRIKSFETIDSDHLLTITYW